MQGPVIYTLFFSLVLWSFSSCEATKAYEQAQTAFSQGATVEMKERFADAADQLPGNFAYFDDLYKSNLPLDENESATGYYEMAMSNINCIGWAHAVGGILHSRLNWIRNIISVIFPLIVNGWHIPPMTKIPCIWMLFCITYKQVKNVAFSRVGRHLRENGRPMADI